MKFERFIDPPLETIQHLGAYLMHIVAPEKPVYKPVPASITYYRTDYEDLVA